MKYYKRDNCRLCKSKKLSKVLELEPTPPADSYITKDKLSQKQETIPLELYLCENCGHTQLGHVIDAEEVYLNYIYETSSSLGLDKHFKICSSEIINKFKPNKSGLMVDIGSNDGTLLSYFKDYGMSILGIDPMPGIAEKAIKNGIPTLSDFFTRSFAKELKRKYGSAEIITSNNLVADTDDLDDFMLGIKELMNKNSIFFFESFYLYLQIKNFVWDFTYHEHYSYFTVKPLIQYFEKFNMEIIDVDLNLIKGGSMRCVVQLKGGKRKIKPSVAEQLRLETEMGVQEKSIFKVYSNRISESKRDLLSCIAEQMKKKKKIIGYGASPTCTNLIYHFEMNKFIKYLVDDFSAKHNLFSPGHHIPVYSRDRIYDEKPDIIVILAWRYRDKILPKLEDFINQGGQIIIPLPNLQIIKK